MRFLSAFFSMLLLSTAIYAQNTTKGSLFNSQFKKVLAATPTNFNSFKGEKIKEEGDDLVFASTTTLQGTSDNQVMDFASGKSYMAKLRDGMDEKTAKLLIESWKKKVSAVAGNTYEVMRDNLNNSESTRIAYLLIGEKSSISIHAMKYAGEKHYSAYLLVMSL